MFSEYVVFSKVTGDSDEDFAIEPWTLMQEKISKGIEMYI
jgi:hypothetical protein